MLNIAGALTIETLGAVRAVADVESGTTVDAPQRSADADHRAR